MKIEEFNEIEEWATKQWGEAELGDKRRNGRAIKIGAEIAAQPDASLPKQIRKWSDLKAAYRLFSEKDVTHKTLGQQHWQQTIAEVSSNDDVVLFIQDVSELSYYKRKGMGHIGNASAEGLVLHSCLALRPGTRPEIIGLANQNLWARKEIHHGQETRAQRYKRRTEYDLWAETLEEIGVPISSNWISVGDSASDIFSYIRRAGEIGWQYILRASQNRAITTTEGASSYLIEWARQLPAQSKKSLLIRGRDGLPKRAVDLQVAYSSVTISPPKVGPERNYAPIEVRCVRCWEESDSDEAIEWILLTSLAINNDLDALRIIEYYSLRWVIEEYHKCLKTGCRAEKNQLEEAQSISALLGFLAIIAVRLLKLREISRTNPEAEARTLVPGKMVDVVVVQLNLVERKPLTVKQFWHGVARLGGFIGRKSDGNPGWQTIWAGWKRLQDLCWDFSDSPYFNNNLSSLDF